DNVTSRPRAAAVSAAMPAGMTSFPMPSPAMTAMRCVFVVMVMIERARRQHYCRNGDPRRSTLHCLVAVVAMSSLVFVILCLSAAQPNDPKPIDSSARPIYPAAARAAMIEGDVQYRAIVRTDGS